MFKFKSILRVFDKLIKLFCCFHLRKKGQFTVIPIMVGQTNAEKEKMYGEILSKYFLQPNTLFVISSDFCHWGMSFCFVPSLRNNF